ncbi:hypothetical protein DFH06DRAFT_1125333 [Mycena polygramma]|nr:hypothetical protein DFH06DRAFT_1125333 [Mycena polygramma]
MYERKTVVEDEERAGRGGRIVDGRTSTSSSAVLALVSDAAEDVEVDEAVEDAPAMKPRTHSSSSTYRGSGSMRVPLGLCTNAVPPPGGGMTRRTCTANGAGGGRLESARARPVAKSIRGKENKRRTDSLINLPQGTLVRGAGSIEYMKKLRIDVERNLVGLCAVPRRHSASEMSIRRIARLGVVLGGSQTTPGLDPDGVSAVQDPSSAQRRRCYSSQEQSLGAIWSKSQSGNRARAAFGISKPPIGSHKRAW